MDFRLLAISALFGAMAFAAACSDDGQPCDPDQKYDKRVCKANSAGTGGSAGSGGTAGTGGSGGGDEDASVDPDAAVVDAPVWQDVPAVWGKACNMPGDAAVDCVGASNYCVARPGSTDGYCSAVDCVGKTGFCPIGWSCFEIPGITNWCARP